MDCACDDVVINGVTVRADVASNTRRRLVMNVHPNKMFDNKRNCLLTESDGLSINR